MNKKCGKERHQPAKTRGTMKLHTGILFSLLLVFSQFGSGEAVIPGFDPIQSIKDAFTSMFTAIWNWIKNAFKSVT